MGFHDVVSKMKSFGLLKNKRGKECGQEGE